MGIIEEFIEQYAKEYDFYENAARLVREAVEQELRSTGVRCIVTSRAKEIDRLREKCRKRNCDKTYRSTDEITADIVDLAGVRVALYFPAQRERVDAVIDRLFDQLEPRREFPDRSSKTDSRRFPGYSALHYRVRLRSDRLSETDKRYSEARVEVQVASVLMHAWSEVEHDLAYKPLSGELSDDERALLDQLNGLVHAGEIALESLQKAGERRIEERERQFSNHYELATYLINHLRELTEGNVSDTELGRVDLLFELLRQSNINTPERLQRYLVSLHGNLEQRALSEQVVDAIIAEDPHRSEIYREILAKAQGRTAETDAETSIKTSFAEFMFEWAKFESLLADLAPSDRWTPLAAIADLSNRGTINPDLLGEMDHIRRIRNRWVHGRMQLDANELTVTTQRLRRIVEELNGQSGA